MKNQIVLIFNESNNFDEVDHKYGVKNEKESIAREIMWLLNNAESSIIESYEILSPRRIQMTKLVNSLKEQLKSQITSEIAEELNIN